MTLVAWLLGSATGPTAEDLHGPRLETFLERLVDTPVRGFVYEAAGTVGEDTLADGERLVKKPRSAGTCRQPWWRSRRRSPGVAGGHARGRGRAALAVAREERSPIGGEERSPIVDRVSTAAM